MHIYVYIYIYKAPGSDFIKAESIDTCVGLRKAILGPRLCHPMLPALLMVMMNAASSAVYNAAQMLGCITRCV